MPMSAHESRPGSESITDRMMAIMKYLGRIVSGLFGGNNQQGK